MECLEIEFASAAAREIKKLSRQQQMKVFAALEALQSEPRPRGVEKISGHPNFLRIRVGHLRVIYHIVDGQLIIVLLVKARRDAYKDLGAIETRLSASKLEIEQRLRVVQGGKP